MSVVSGGWRLRFVVCAVLTSILLAGAVACGGSSSSGSGDADVLRVGTRNILDILNPFTATNHQSFNAFHLMYPTLVAYNGDGELVGDWAENWETSSNGRVWTFHLRKGQWSERSAANCRRRGMDWKHDH